MSSVCHGRDAAEPALFLGFRGAAAGLRTRSGAGRHTAPVAAGKGDAFAGDKAARHSVPAAFNVAAFAAAVFVRATQAAALLGPCIAGLSRLRD